MTRDKFLYTVKALGLLCTQFISRHCCDAGSPASCSLASEEDLAWVYYMGHFKFTSKLQSGPFEGGAGKREHGLLGRRDTSAAIWCGGLLMPDIRALLGVTSNHTV